ncbi:Tetraacyldisaccharide-1-P 4'-kinase [Candidatus Magnetoovum chiemensis]|nr:Tetraacyldisaccharide-1-P 4'-kinase [Candidatus Magnetoovum chiemensis]
MSGEDINVKQPFAFNLFRLFLFVLSIIYGSVVSLRLWLYEKQILKSRKVPCFVISIGNIVAGGSGKTPMAIYIAEMVKSMGFNPVVISRGYGGNLRKKRSKTYRADSFEMKTLINNSRVSVSEVYGNVVVGDGNKVFETPEVVGDEPFMMASRLSFPVIVGKDRFKAAIMALNLSYSKPNKTNGKIDSLSKKKNDNFLGLPNMPNIDVIILDDGFQHIQLKRDLDIVLMDYSRPFGNGYLLPSGRLREPLKRAIDRADIIIFTRYNSDHLKSVDGSYLEKIISRKGKNKTCFVTKHRPFLHSFLHKAKPFSTNLKTLKGRKGCLFSGIAITYNYITINFRNRDS